MKRRKVYGRYEGGKQTKLNAKDIQENELVSAKNVYLDKVGSLRSAGVSAINSTDYGSITFSNGIATGAGFFQGTFDYTDAGTTTDVVKNFVAYKDTTAGRCKIKTSEGSGSFSNLVDNSTDDNDIEFQENAKLFYHIAEGNLRIADRHTTFASTSTPQWYGYIKKTNFAGQTVTGQSLDGYYCLDNDIAAPTHLDNNSFFSGLSNGNGWNFSLTDGGDDGYWEAGTYDIAASFVYDGNQESLLKVETSGITLSSDNRKININGVRGSGPFNPRVTGSRFYIREQGTDDPWTLLFEVSLIEGYRNQIGSQYTAWTYGSGYTVAVSGTVSEKPNIDTYETINGYSPDEFSVSLGSANNGYRTAAVASGRTFVGFVKTKDKKTNELRVMPDTIMYSEVGKYDTFPTSNYLDIGANDGEEIIRLESFADRLLAFKNKKLYIINIGGGADTQWFVESEHSSLGVNSYNAVLKVDFGVLWVNESGMFYYDGSSIKNLQTKILDEDWAGDFGGSEVSLGYLPKRKFIVIMKDSSSTSGNEDVLLYHLPTNSFVDIDNFRAVSTQISNMITDSNGKISFYQDAGTEGVYSFDGSQTDLGNAEILFRFDDLGEPHLKKKFFKVLVNYTSSVAQETPFTYNFIDGSGDYTDTASNTLTGDMSISATNPIIDEFLFNSNESPKIGQGLQLKFTPSTNDGKFEINDVSIVYRLLDGKLIGD